MTIHEGTSTSKPPLFDGTIFSFWKIRMRTYLMALGADVWDVVETGYIKPILLASKDDKLEFSFNAKGMNAILNGLAEAEFVKVMHLETTKALWGYLGYLGYLVSNLFTWSGGVLIEYLVYFQDAHS
jgi:hypothetical protein